MDYASCLNVALDAAGRAGRVILDGLGSQHTLRFKNSHSDLVTEFDPRAEAEIVRVISAAFPHHQIIAEEGSRGGADPDYCWYVDPIDGTTNFAHGLPLVCTSIALAERGEVVVGVVHAPALQETFVAVKGGGATLNGKPLRVSTVATLQRSLVATGFPYERDKVSFNMRCWEAFLHNAQGVRRDGCAALDLCSVARGHFDGFWEYGFAVWDMAAGGLIVREAGGVMTLPDGTPLPGVSRDVVASNGLIHGQMLGILASVPRDERIS